MSLLKRHVGRRRHIGRRVAGVGVGVALVVLGLEAPAFAALSVTAISPNSGPADCVVVITGTDFNNPNVNSVVFLGDVANPADDADAIFQIRSGTEIWTTVPATAVNGPIRLTNTAAATADTPAFTVADPGNCAPTITSFTPTCGPEATPPTDVTGTDVTITGTNLLDNSGGTLTGGAAPAAAGGDVRFAPYTTVATPTAAPATPVQIAANVPAGALDGPIKVTTFGALDGTGTVTSTATFDEGTCITSFAPTSGSVGTVVTITGVGFQGATSVTFNGSPERVPASFQVASDTEAEDTITATVPFGAITGPIRVEAPGGTATSPADFTVDGDEEVTKHPRSVTLTLKKHLVARGVVSVDDGFTACAAGVRVKIQRRVSGRWKTVGSDTTNDNGVYKDRIKDKPGKYRARATRVTLNDGADVCQGARSPARRHRH